MTSRLALVALTTFLAAPALAQEVKVGIPIAATGQFSFAGAAARNGIEIAREEIEKSGTLGSLKLKLLVEDTASDKNQAVTLVDRFVKSDKVSLILGTTSSVEAFAALPIAQENKVPVLSIASADVTTVGDWVFKASTTPVKITEALGEQYYERFAPKKAAYVFNRDNEAYIAQKNGVRDLFVEKGVATVAEETIVGSDADFTTLATKLAGLDIDTLVIATTAELSANIIIQAKQAGLSDKIRIVGTPSFASPQFLKVGGAAVEGTVLVSDYFTDGTGDINKRFVAAYKAKYGVAPDIFAALGYTQLHVAAAAVKNAGTNPTAESIRDGIGKVRDLPTLLGTGKLTETPTRTPIYGGVVLTVKNGKFTQL